MLSRIKTAAAWGSHVGIAALMFTVIECLVLFCMDMFMPVHNIDVIHQFEKESYCEEPLSYGNHKENIKDLATNFTERAATVCELKERPESHENVTVDLYSNKSKRSLETDTSESVVDYPVDIIPTK